MDEFKACLLSLADGSSHNEVKFQKWKISLVRTKLQSLASVSELLKLKTPFILVQKYIENINNNADNTFDCNPSCAAEANFNSTQIRSSSVKSGEESIASENEFEGSPLELQVFADLSSINNASIIPKQARCVQESASEFVPITSGQARYLLSLYSNAVHKSTGKTPIQMVVLCDGKDRQSTVCLSVSPVFKSIDNGMVYIGMNNQQLTIRGPQKDVVKLSTALKNEKGTEVNCFAKYDICGTSLVESRTETDRQSTLSIEVFWSKAWSLLQPPPSDAKAVVNVTVLSGDMRSPIYSLYHELAILGTFIDALTTNEVNWVIESSDVPLLLSVKQLVERLQLGDAWITTENNTSAENDTDFSSPLASIVFEERKDQDFTDRLWNVFINCSSYAELVDCLRYILTELKKGELQPLVYKTNTTTLAQMVRDSYVGKLVIPKLVGLLPLQILCEMGAEKLRRDYINVFLSKELATQNCLEHFIVQDMTLEERQTLLEKLHNVLELVAMLKMYLIAPVTTLSSSARQALKHYETNEISEKYTFELSIPMASIMRILDNCQPAVWKWVSTKMVESVPENVLYYFTTKQPFSYLPKSNFEINMEESTVSDDNCPASYYLVNGKDSMLILV